MDPKKSIETTIFVKGLNPSTSSTKLKYYFERFGEVARVLLKTEKDTGVSRGFGFITFKNHYGSQEALAVSKHVIDGRKIKVVAAVLPTQAIENKIRDPNSFVVLLSGVPMDTNKKDLQVFLSGFDSNISWRLTQFIRSKQRTKYCYINFTSETEAYRFLTIRRIPYEGGVLHFTRVTGRSDDPEEDIEDHGTESQMAPWDQGLAEGSASNNRQEQLPYHADRLATGKESFRTDHLLVHSSKLSGNLEAGQWYLQKGPTKWERVVSCHHHNIPRTGGLQHNADCPLVGYRLRGLTKYYQGHRLEMAPNILFADSFLQYLRSTGRIVRQDTQKFAFLRYELEQLHPNSECPSERRWIPLKEKKVRFLYQEEENPHKRAFRASERNLHPQEQAAEQIRWNRGSLEPSIRTQADFRRRQ